MANNDREINLIIAAKTAGREKIQELAADVEKLAAEGGSAAPQFRKLADELKKLEQQQGLIDQFAELSQQAKNTKAAFEQASDAARKSSEALQQRRTELTAVATAEKATGDAIRANQAALAEANQSYLAAKAELAALRAEVAQSGQATGEQAKAIAEAKAQVAGYSASLAGLKAAIAAEAPAHRENTAALREATTAVKQASTANDQAQRASATARGEYEKTITSLQGVGTAMDKAGLSTRNLAGAQQQVATEVKKVGDAVQDAKAKVNSAGEGFSSLTNLVRGAGAQLTALFAAVAGVREFVRINLEVENLNRSLTVIMGSSKAAAAEWQYLKEASNRLGLELISTAKAYTQFAAAAKGTSVEGAKTREIFEAVANAMTVAGKGSEDINGALTALGQMLSKGTVSMEEFRGQLAERLPGAMKATADALGITVAELNKLIESGNVLAVDLLPKVGEGLTKMYGQAGEGAKTVSQQWNNFKTAIAETYEELGKSGALQTVLELIRSITVVAVGFGNALSVVGTLIGTTFGAAIQSVGNLYDLLRTGDLKSFQARAVSLAESFRDSMVVELDRAAASVKKFADQSDWTKAALGALGLSTDQTAQKTAAAATTAEASVVPWTKLQQIYGQLTADQEKATAAAEKAVVARRAEGDAAIALAGSLGTELDRLNAATQAAEANEKAAVELAKQREGMLAILQSELQAQLEYVKVTKDTSKERQDQIKALQQKIAVTKEETERTVAQAQATKIATEAARLNAASFADNSGRVKELADEYVRTATELKGLAALNAVSKQNVADLTREFAAGKPVLEQLSQAKRDDQAVTERYHEAQTAAARAAAAFRDALKDQIGYLQASRSVKEAENEIARLGVQLKLQEIDNEIAVARELGNNNEVRRLTIERREREIELLRLQVDLQRQEAEINLEIVRVTRQDLEARGELTRTKELELKRDELLAQAKLKQAEATERQIEGMKDLNRVMEGGKVGVIDYARATDQAADAQDRFNRVVSSTPPPAPPAPPSGPGGGGGGGGGGPGGGDYGGGSGGGRKPDRSNAEQEFIKNGKQGESFQRDDGTTIWKNAGGQISSNALMGGYTLSAEEMHLNQYRMNGTGLTPSDIPYLLQAYQAAKNNDLVAQKSVGNYTLDAKRESAAEVQRLRRALEEMGVSPDEEGGGNSSLAVATQKSEGGFSTVHKVTINIPGVGEQTVQTASADDSSNLVNLLQKMGQDKLRTL